MNTPESPMKTCKQCGQPMASDAPEGLCARCLLSAAVAATPPSPAVPAASSPPGVDFPDIADAAEVARRLPQFEIVKLLGRGGMGVVYQARQVNLDRIVALKILPPVDALTPDFVERFRREARSLAKLSHPNIVGVHDFGESGGLYYFVMEFIDGVNLRDTMRTGKMTPAEALAVVPKICDALQFAHEEGVVHRDIKPENILLDKRGRVKIADFGLAKLLRREATDHTLTMSGMTLGTPRYMAPEQLDKPESVDHRADIYSLGVVFYEMLTGEVPMGRFAPPSEKVQIDVRLDEIVLHALERDADRRYQHASQVRDDVEKVTSKPQVAPAHSSPPPVSPPASTPATSEPGSVVAFLRLSLWLFLVICAAVFLVFDMTPTAGDRAASLHDTVHIGVVQPWLHYGEDPYGHARFRMNFLTLSAGAGLCGLVAALALFSTRRRDVRTRVRRAAVGLLVSGVAGAVMAFAFTMMLINEGQWDKRFAGCIVGIVINVSLAVLAVFTFRGALKMLHGEGYAASRRAALCSIFSFNIVSLPAGIWALLVLSKPEVKALFTEPAETLQPPLPAGPKPPPRHLLSALLGLLFIFGVGFGFSFHAKSAGDTAGLTQIITVGALDPLYTNESGPRGFQTGINFFSWSFLAALVAGVAFGALWRIGREDQGKVPRDPAWWRAWWKQVGVWGGLVLIVCIVRTVRHPEQVLQPPGDRTVAAKFTKLLDFSPAKDFRIRSDPARVSAPASPGREDYAFTFKSAPDHAIELWLEFWRDGRVEVHTGFSDRVTVKAGVPFTGTLHLTMMDGDMASVESAGKTRIDWQLDYESNAPGWKGDASKSSAKNGTWRANQLKGSFAQSSTWDEPRDFQPKPGETVTLLTLCGFSPPKRELSTHEMAWDESTLRQGWPNTAIILRARFVPVQPDELVPVHKKAAIDAQEAMTASAPALEK